MTDLKPRSRVVVFSTPSDNSSPIALGRLVEPRVVLLDAADFDETRDGERAWVAIAHQSEDAPQVSTGTGVIKSVAHELDESGPLVFVELDEPSVAPADGLDDPDAIGSHEAAVAAALRHRSQLSPDPAFGDPRRVPFIGDDDPVGLSVLCRWLGIGCPRRTIT